MATPHFFTKQPSEEYDITVDFATYRLESGESIQSISVSAVKESDASDATSDVIDDSGQSAGIVTIRVKDGTDGERYGVKVAVTTDSVPANKYESDVIMEVIDNP